MRRWLAHVPVRRTAEQNPVAVCAVVLSLCVLFFWARYEIFWARYTPPRVNVRWSDAITQPAREALEAEYRLRAARHEEGRTWSYVPADTSAATIRRLVADPAVEDTYNIDRRRFELAGENRPGPLEGPYWLAWSVAIGVAAGLMATWIGLHRWRRAGSIVARAVAAAFNVAAPAVAAPLRVAASVGATAFRVAGSALTRGVPELRADVLGFFRFFYAVFLFLALTGERLDLEPGRIPDDGQLGWRWLGWLASRPDLMALLEYAILGLLVLFAIGLWTRVAYWLIAAGMTSWVLVWIESQHSNAHKWLVTLFMILCLVPVPWDAGLSLDAAIRRRRGGPSGSGLGSRRYGYAVWMPGLILGTVWASAAYAKLEESGPAWVLGGAVKYHWVLDARHAPVDWGLWVASHHWAAVLMSFCGVLFEAMFILSVFVKPGRWRHLLASTGLALLVGFFLFHDVLWWPWWLAYLSFVIPWTPLFDSVPWRLGNWLRATDRAGGVPGPAGDLRPIQILLVILVCVHAMLVLPAGFGRFESYSSTYGSTGEFDRINPIYPAYRLWVGYGSAAAVEVEAPTVVDAVLRLAQDTPLLPGRARTIPRLDELERLVRDSPRRLTLTRQQRNFGWTTGRFSPAGPPVVIGTLDLESMAFVGEEAPALPSAPSPAR